ncbi:MAG: type II secretion system protein [Phycisphaerales bacterium]|nr:type II secretion system protein [Phycisphaerales bacterium]
MNKQATRQRGYGLIETVVGVTIVGLMILILVPALHNARSQMHRSNSTAKLMMIGQGGAMYAQGNSGRLFGYSWRPGETYMLPDGRTYTELDALRTSARQNQEVLMRRTGRTIGEFKILLMGLRVPHRRYSHLVLMDYLNLSIESKLFIDPADEKLERWHDNPLEYRDQVMTIPYAHNQDYVGYDEDGSWLETTVRQRWTFGSSYHSGPSVWQADYPSTRYIPLSRTPHLFASTFFDTVDLHNGRSLEEVAMPSNKVWLFEEFDREQAGDPYFAYGRSRTEKLMFDGSVNSWLSGEASRSVVPENGGIWAQTYVPLDQFPIPLGGLGDERLINQRFRWTHLGLSGVDYGLSEPARGPKAR